MTVILKDIPGLDLGDVIGIVQDLAGPGGVATTGHGGVVVDEATALLFLGAYEAVRNPPPPPPIVVAQEPPPAPPPEIPTTATSSRTVSAPAAPARRAPARRTATTGRERR